jgi:hypothetical protein
MFSSVATRASSRRYGLAADGKKAEEDAARRLNVGRAGNTLYAGGLNRAKQPELFDRTELQQRLTALGTLLLFIQTIWARLTLNAAREHNLVFDEDAYLYLALAAETRIRTLLTSSVSAQLHRTTTSHFHIPPASSSGKPMWSHRIIDDPNAVMDALARQNKEAEQTFRASRMDRIARETEIQRARDRAEKISAAAVGASAAPGGVEDGDLAMPSSGPSTPRDKPTASGGDATPTFGGVKEKAPGSSGKKTGKKAGRDLSAEVAHKMSNATAMRSAGFKQGKYSWLTSVPSISSPLAGKKKKGKTGAGDGGVKGETADGTAEGGEADAPGSPSAMKSGVGSREKGKSKLRESTTTTIGEELRRTPRRARPNISVPTRRTVLVELSGKVTGEERRVPDDKALTMVDVLFALERDGLGKGMGTADEIVRKMCAMPGGPWGRGGDQRR